VKYPVGKCPLGRLEFRWKDICAAADDDEGQSGGNRH